MSDRRGGNLARREPTFSVVICTYNRARVLPRAMESVLSQSFEDFELIIVDDGSSDATGEVVAARSDGRVRYVRQENAGLGAARNHGVEHARGRYVVFLDDDDLALPGWLEGLNAERARQECAVVCCGEVVVDEDDRVLGTNLPMQLGQPFANYRGLFVAGVLAVRREAYEAVGGFVPELQDCHHLEFALRLFNACAENGWCVGTIDRPLLQRRVHPPGQKQFTPRHLLDGTRYVLDHHGDKLARIPGLYAQFSSVAGVAAARTGDYGEARRLFRQAARTSHRNWRHRARLALACVPPMANMVWRTKRYRAPA